MFLDTLVRYGQTYQMEKNQMQNSLFGGDDAVEIATPPIPEAEPWSDLERLNRERDLVGIYLSAHPLDEYQIILKHVCNTGMNEFGDLKALKDREELVFGGMVVGLRKGVSKKGDPYGIAKIEDFTGNAEIPLWRNDWAVYQGFVQEKMIVLIHAKVEPSKWNSNLELKISKMELMSDVKDSLIQKFTVTLPLQTIDESFVESFTEMCQRHPGNADLYLKIQDTGSKMAVDMVSHPVKVAVDREFVSFLDEIENVSYHVN
jgi:DNA polymerase-3 subunit alpha